MDGGDMKWPWLQAMEVAQELWVDLWHFADQVEIAGSLRRLKEEVGDIEIIYIPKLKNRQMASVTDEWIAELLVNGVLKKRPNKRGHFTWGQKNKLALHHSGIPVDLFAATETNWWNYLVCRTGPAESNMRIASAAIRKGWKWNPYGAGFTRDGVEYVVKSERDVFDFVELPYLEPWDRK